MHNYYRIAANVNIDLSEISFIVNKSLYNRLKKKLKKKSKSDIKNKSSPYLKLYGDCNGKVKSIGMIDIFPIYGIKYNSVMNFTQEINSYTEQGRELIHNKINNINGLIQYLLIQKDYNKSTVYNDCTTPRS